MWRGNFPGAVALAGAVFACVPVAAAADEWAFEFTPYAWAIGMEGDAGVRGKTSDVDMSFSDVLDNFDGAFLAMFIAEKGPWTVGVDFNFLDLEQDGSGVITSPGGDVTVDKAYSVGVESTIVQFSLGYRILDDTTRVDLIGATRYTKLDLELDVTAGGIPELGFPGGAFSAGEDESWWDAVIGARVVHPLSSQWSLVGYADVGGGESDLTYQASLGAIWSLNERFTVKGGYRYLSWDYEDGGTVWDMEVRGPYLGLGIAF